MSTWQARNPSHESAVLVGVEGLEVVQRRLLQRTHFAPDLVNGRIRSGQQRRDAQQFVGRGFGHLRQQDHL